jgi:hypothetical protein
MASSMSALAFHGTDRGDDIGLHYAGYLGDLVENGLSPSVESLQSSWATIFSSDNTTTLANLQFSIWIALSMFTVVTAFAVCSSSMKR